MSKNLLSNLKNLSETIKAKKFLFLFLDYDGTLSPISKKPEQAKLPSKNKKIIRSLLKRKLIKIAIISGRSLEDVKKMVGLRKVIYAGHHGMQIKGNGFKFEIKKANYYKKIIGEICGEVKGKISHIPGAWMENKKLTASLHYRLANKKYHKKLSQILKQTIKDYRGLKISYGKKVLEIRPDIDWNKGEAVRYILKRSFGTDWQKKITALYIGDDKTDYDAFKVLKKGGINILVGRGSCSRPYIHYSLRGPSQVTWFLSWLSRLSLREIL